MSLNIFGRIIMTIQNLFSGEPVSRSGVVMLAVCGVAFLLCLLVGWLYFRKPD